MNVSKTESKYTSSLNKSGTINKGMRGACDYEDPVPHTKSNPSSSKSENIAAVLEQPLYECVEVRFDDSLDLFTNICLCISLQNTELHIPMTPNLGYGGVKFTKM